MATDKGARNVALTLAAAGAGIMGAAVVFGLTTDTGAIDWVGIIMATARFDHGPDGHVQGVPARHASRWLSPGPLKT